MKYFIFVLAVMLGCAVPQGALAQVPQLIHYQGRVAVSGNAFTGSGQFKFALVNGDGSVTYWSNDGTSNNGSEPNTSVGISAANGLFSVLLGDTSLNNMSSILPGVFANSDVRLRIWFNDGQHGFQQMTPDQRLASVGYAMTAANASVAATVPDGAITSAKLSGNAVSSGNLAPGAAVDNLQASGQSAVPSGGIILSTSAAAANLLNAGYQMVGQIAGAVSNSPPPTSGAEAWNQRSNNNAPQPRWGHTVVWTGSEMIVWGGINANYLSDGGRYNPSTQTWMPLPASGLAPRQFHVAVWTGSKMIVWGGYDNGIYLNDGAMYDPASNTWSSVTTSGAPVIRDAPVAIWTGTEMIIWGGYNNNGTHYLGDGAKYNPNTDTWTPMATANAPVARYFHTAVWTGTEMIVWGGSNGDGAFLNSGARYNPSANTWTPISSSGAPVGRFYQAAVWTGTEMLIWGGYGASGYLGDGARYNLANNSWTAMSSSGAPGPRFGHSWAWTGNEMIIWGGYNFGSLNDGARYNPSNNSWTAMITTGEPSARNWHSAVWTGSEMLIFGGIYNSTTYFNDTFSYSTGQSQSSGGGSGQTQTLYLYLKP
ncbi:Kelch repeat-containing protein [Pedosphaera parvula]|nr:kelch repeat-containing protein [Pedosphaera parvula]